MSNTIRKLPVGVIIPFFGYASRYGELASLSPRVGRSVSSTVGQGWSAGVVTFSPVNCKQYDGGFWRKNQQKFRALQAGYPRSLHAQTLRSPTSFNARFKILTAAFSSRSILSLHFGHSCKRTDNVFGTFAPQFEQSCDVP